MFKITEKANELREELTAKGREPISLAMGAPTCRPPQFVIDEIKKLIDIDAMHTYSSPKGEKTYLEAVANRMKKRFGVELNPKTEICSLIGSKEGIANMIRALINPKHDIKDKDIILTPNPSYASYKEMVKVSGGYSYSVPLNPENNFMPDLDEVWDNLIKDGFNPKKVKALLVNYPSNPLGATATLDYYKHAVEFCKKHHILLIGDSAYCDLYYDESKKPHSILEVEGAKDIAVEFFSFSKPYAMTGWRLGYACGNKVLIDAMKKIHQYAIMCSPTTAQFAAIEASAYQADLPLCSPDINLANAIFCSSFKGYFGKYKFGRVFKKHGQ